MATNPSTTGTFNYLDPSSLTTEKPWSKADTQAYKSFSEIPVTLPVYDFRASPSDVRDADVTGFALHDSPSNVPASDVLSSRLAPGSAARDAYYAEIEAAAKAKLGAQSVVIWDHTIRVRDPDSARQPVQSVHVDQTPSAALNRVRQHGADHVSGVEAGRRFQLVNVWRPLGPAVDHPLALLDWRSTEPEDLVPIDLLYPIKYERGNEVQPDAASLKSREGYEPRGETYRVIPKERHRWWYVKDMREGEVIFLKCYDSAGQGQPNGKKGVAGFTPHTAFQDPQTPEDAAPRKSVEVRCLVFY